MVTGVEATTDALGAGTLTASSSANIGGVVPGFSGSGVADFAFALGFPADPPTSGLISDILADNAAIAGELGGPNAEFFGYGTQGATASADASGPETLTSTEQFTLNGADAAGDLIVGLIGDISFGTGFTSLTFTVTVGGTHSKTSSSTRWRRPRRSSATMHWTWDRSRRPTGCRSRSA